MVSNSFLFYALFITNQCNKAYMVKKLVYMRPTRADYDLIIYDENAVECQRVHIMATPKGLQASYSEKYDTFAFFGDDSPFYLVMPKKKFDSYQIRQIFDNRRYSTIALIENKRGLSIWNVGGEVLSHRHSDTDQSSFHRRFFKTKHTFLLHLE